MAYIEPENTAAEMGAEERRLPMMADGGLDMAEFDLKDEFAAKSFMGFEGTWDQVLEALSKQGNESIIGRSVGAAGNNKTAQEKKKKFDANMAQVIERQRQAMLGQLDAAINNLSKQIEDDQAILAKMRKEETALKEINDLQAAKEFDTNKADHLQLVDDAGFDKEEFVNKSQEEQEAAVDERLGDVKSDITKMVDKISANMDSLTILIQAHDDLNNAEKLSTEKKAKIQHEVGLRLQKADIVIDDLAAKDGGLVQSIKYGISDAADNKLDIQDEISNMDIENLTDLILQAREKGLPEEKIQSYETILANKLESEAVSHADMSGPAPS